jgi:hypothetical protein
VADLHRSGRVLISFAVARVGGRPTVWGEGEQLATNPEEPPEERQRRELEEIRRKFQEVGARLGSAFEPAAPDDDDRRPRALPPPAPTVDRPARPRWQWAAAAALIFVLGTGFGDLLTRSDAGDPPATTPATSAPALPPPTRIPAVGPTPNTRVVPPPACLEAVRRGNELFDLLTSKTNDQRLVADKLKAYSLASQACSKEASP